jgi:MFS family permease
MASSNTVLQTIVDDDKRGRVMSFYTMAFVGTAPFGSLLVGALAERFGVAWALGVGGGSCVLAAFVFGSRLPLLRELIRPIYVSRGIIPELARGIQAATHQATPRTDE